MKPRRFPLYFLLALALLLTLLLLYPVRNGITRPAILLTLFTSYVLLLVILWRHRIPRIALLLLPLFLAILLILPRRNPDPALLQQAYVNALRAYAGTRYVWGGENRFGVDCSGLVRAAMVDAELRQSLRHANPALLRQALWLWWHDSAARDMPNGYHGRMQTLFSTNTIRQSIDQLRPGDIAVTGDGGHVIAYLGADRWIEADPDLLRVCEWSSNERPTSLDRPMIYIRWQVLNR